MLFTDLRSRVMSFGVKFHNYVVFQSVPMTLGNSTRKVASNAGLTTSKNLTGRSVKKTLVQKLQNIDVRSSKSATHHTSHKNIQTFHSYSALPESHIFQVSWFVKTSSQAARPTAVSSANDALPLYASQIHNRMSVIAFALQ